MAPEPVNTADIAQTPSQDTKQQHSYTRSAESAPSPQDGLLLPQDGLPLPLDGLPLSLDGLPLPLDGLPLSLDGLPLPLGADHYLTRGLEGVETQHYHGTESFMTAIKVQTDQLHSGNAGQYAVFSHITPQQLAHLDNFRDTHCKSVRFLYYESKETLIVRIMPGKAHQFACKGFEAALVLKLAEMGLQHELRNAGATTYQGIGCAGEADSSYIPRSSRPLRADWPTLVIEYGVSQSLKHLCADASWWLTSSPGQVKIVLLFSISEKNRKIHIEQWEMGTGSDEQITDSQDNPQPTRPECVKTIEIAETNARGAFLQLSFQKLFLREPEAGEMDIVFSIEDLERFAANAWPEFPIQKSIGRSPPSPAIYRRSHLSSAISSNPPSLSNHRGFHSSSSISRHPLLSHHEFHLSSAVSSRPLSTFGVFSHPPPPPAVVRRHLPSTAWHSFASLGLLPLVVGAVLHVRRPGRATSVLCHQILGSWKSSGWVPRRPQNTVSRVVPDWSHSPLKFSNSAIPNSGS